MTEWKEVKGFSGYEISDTGLLRDKETQRLIPQSKSGNGYLKAKLYNDGKVYTKSIHRLEATTFLGDGYGLEVNHKDGNKTNNNLCNLEFVTKSENAKHAYKLGLRKIQSDEKHCKKVLCDNGKEYESVNAASRALNVDKAEIRRVYQGGQYLMVD